MRMDLTWDQVEEWRDRVHRRRPSLAVSTKRQALKFVNEVGFCFAFKAENAELPCMWHAACGSRDPVMPEHTHHDPCISFVWEMKEVLPGERKIYYGKLLKHRPTMVSLEFLPFFYALSGRTGARAEYQKDFLRGRLPRAAKEIMDALLEMSPQTTKGLKLATGMDSRSDRTLFDKAIAELQERMYIVKITEQHDPFSFVWAPLTSCFPLEVKKAKRISPDIARLKILEQYFRNQLVGAVSSIHRLFRWNKQDIYRTLGALVQRGVVVGNIKIEGQTGKLYSFVHKK